MSENLWSGRIGRAVRVQYYWRAWLLREIESVSHVVGGVVTAGHGDDAESLLDDFQPGFEGIAFVIHVALPGIRTDDQSRNANAQPVLIHFGGIDVVVESAPIVPGNKDDG